MDSVLKDKDSEQQKQSTEETVTQEESLKLKQLQQELQIAKEAEVVLQNKLSKQIKEKTELWRSIKMQKNEIHSLICQLEKSKEKFNKKTEELQETKLSLEAELAANNQLHEEKIKTLAKHLDKLAGELYQQREVKKNAKSSAVKMEKDMQSLQKKLEAANLLNEEAAQKIKTYEQQDQTNSAIVEEKQNKFDQQIHEWKIRCDELQGKVDNAKKEARNYSNEFKQDAQNQVRRISEANAQLQKQIEELKEGKADLLKQLMRANAELAQMKTKFEQEAVSNRLEELEDSKRKLALKLNQTEEALSSASQKAINAEEAKNRLNSKLEDTLIDLEKAQTNSAILVEKQNKFDQQIHEWKIRCDELQVKLDTGNKEARNYSNEHSEANLDKMQKQIEELEDGKADLQKQLMRANTELAQIKTKFEQKLSRRLEESEDSKRKLVEKLNDTEEAFSRASQKASNAEKAENILNAKLRDTLIDLEKAERARLELEKKLDESKERLEEQGGAIQGHNASGCKKKSRKGGCFRHFFRRKI